MLSLIGCSSAFAQNANEIFNLFSGMVQTAIAYLQQIRAELQLIDADRIRALSSIAEALNLPLT